MKMYLRAQSESEVHQHFKSANPTAGAAANGSKKKGKASISRHRVTHTERAAPWMTASFQHSRRDGPVRGLVFRQARLACALVIAAWINVIVSAQAGAEGLDVVPLPRVIVSDNVLFHLHTTLLTSVHPFIPLNHQCLLWVPTHLTFLHCSPSRGRREPHVCHCYQLLSRRRRFDVILGLILPQRLDLCVNSVKAFWPQMGWHVIVHWL